VRRLAAAFPCVNSRNTERREKPLGSQNAFALRYIGAVDTALYYYYNVLLIMLGEFEYLLITAAAGLGEGAYGAAIREEIEASTERRCSMGALYTTIDRLESKGLLKTWMGEATSQRGGRAKRMVRVTAKGANAAKDFYAAVVRASRGASWVESRMGRAS
jgi:PadR family transcriptional regulator, regulatory protein PadR